MINTTDKRSKKIKTGDNVQIMNGKSKGHRGLILSYKDHYVVVDGAHTLSRHVPVSDEHQTGIRQVAVNIHVSNVMLIDTETDKPTRAGFRFDDNKEKYRFAKKSNQKI